VRTTRILLIVTVVACALGTLAAPAAFAANEIVYRCDLDICLLDPANPSAVTNLTDNGEASYDEKPIWSPDGKKVAFVSDYTKAGHGQKNVFVMEPGAAEQSVNLATQITEYSSGGKTIGELAWSPDGSRIAYRRGNNSNDDEVLVVNADGTSTFPLTIGSPGDNKHPTWSADSSKIAYSSGNQIYVASSTGGLGTALANGVGREPEFSPDGTRVAFDWPNGIADYVDLRIVNADGSGSPVTVVDPFPYSEWTFAAWSPDSGRVAYRGHGEGEDFDVRVVNANGTGDHALPGSSAENVYAPSWSPDGKRVAYEAYRWMPSPNNNIYVANADGSGSEVPLTTNGKSYEPVWLVIGSAQQKPPPNPGSKKPKVVWITKRIPFTPGQPFHMLIVGCDAPVCSTSSEGKMKASRAAGLSFRSAPQSASRRSKGGKRPKWVVVGHGKKKLKQGQTRKLTMRLNKAGTAAVEKLGKATIQVTVTIKVSGRKKPYRFSHAIHLYLKQAGGKH
jgi:Tol biopolymer transport system component